MKRRSIGLILGLALSSTLAFAAERPNILFIFSDDHSPNAIGAYNGWLADLDPTPHIDRLAAEGALFERSFCTNSICGPSRAVILTGKHSHINGFRSNGNQFDPSQPTFPKQLRSSGYETAIIGKWHLGSKPTGFDYWRVLPGQGVYYNPRFVTPDGPVTIEGHCTEIVTDLAEAWLRNERSDDKPFLLMCQHKAPHRNWMPAPEHLSLWADTEIPEPPTLFDQWEDNASPAREQQMSIADDLDLEYDLFVTGISAKQGRGSRDVSGRKNLEQMNPEQRLAWDAAYEEENRQFAADPPKGKALIRWKMQRYLKNYLRCVRGVDDSVGRLVDLLDELGLAENTIVIYSSDQGFYLGDHGWFDKRWMYDESMAMPLIVRWPGVTEPGSRVKQLVQNLDYAPTLLDVAGETPSETLQGTSLVPLLRGETLTEWRDALYYHYYDGPPAIHHVAKHYGVRTESHKLIYFYENDEWELYDLVNDPDELTNVFGKPGYESITASLKTRLRELREQYGDNANPQPSTP